MTISELFIEKKDRSIIFANLYAITLDSVAPVSRLDLSTKYILSFEFLLTLSNGYSPS